MYILFNVTDQFHYVEIQTFEDYLSAKNGYKLVCKDYPTELFMLVRFVDHNY